MDVTLSFSSSSVICYTVEGTPPGCMVEPGPGVTCDADGGVVYPPKGCAPPSLRFEAGAPIHLTPPPDGGAVAVKAMACRAGDDDSDTTTAIYTFATP